MGAVAFTASAARAQRQRARCSRAPACRLPPQADTELPLRQIDNLAIFRSREDGSREMCTLDEALELEPLRLGGARPGGRGRAAQREAPRVSMTGVLHCLGEEEAGHPPLRVELGPPRDWCIEHDQLPCIWIVTDHGEGAAGPGGGKQGATGCRACMKRARLRRPRRLVPRCQDGQRLLAQLVGDTAQV